MKSDSGISNPPFIIAVADRQILPRVMWTTRARITWVTWPRGPNVWPWVLPIWEISKAIVAEWRVSWVHYRGVGFVVRAEGIGFRVTQRKVNPIFQWFYFHFSQIPPLSSCFADSASSVNWTRFCLQRAHVCILHMYPHNVVSF